MATVVTSDPEKARCSSSETMLASSVHTPGLPILPPSSPAALGLATPSPPVSRSGSRHSFPRIPSNHSLPRLEQQEYAFQVPPQDIELIASGAPQHSIPSTSHDDLTLPEQEEVGCGFRKKTYRETLTIYEGRISREKWWKAALRPFILYAYPAIAFVRRTRCIVLTVGHVVVFVKYCVAHSSI